MDPLGPAWRIDGRPAAPGAAWGPLTPGDAPATPHGVVLLEHARPQHAPAIVAAAATVTRGGAALSHATLLCRELGKPSVAIAPTPGDDEPERRLHLLFDDRAGEFPEALGWGDVVLVDGDLGTITVPGAPSPEQRARVRLVSRRLAEFADGKGDIASLVDSAAVSGAALGFLIETLLWCEPRVPDSTAREILASIDLSSCAQRFAALRARILDRGQRDYAAIRAELSGLNDGRRLGELSRQLARRGRRDRFALEVLGSGDQPLATLRRELEQTIETGVKRRTREVAGVLAEADRLDDRRLLGRHRRLRSAFAEARVFPETARSAQALALRFDTLVARLAKQPWVVPLDPASPARPADVGGKAANLLCAAELIGELGRVPPGAVVSTAAHRLHQLGELRAELERILAAGESSAQISRAARAAILARPVPDEVAAAIDDACRRFRPSPVAVRSSATLEDLDQAPLAGALDSTLGVPAGDVVRRVREVWASGWDARALALLRRAGRTPLELEIAVIVQQSIAARASGVLFTRDPREPQRSVINAAWGLGEALAAGEVGGQLFRVERESGREAERVLGDDRTQIEFDPAGPGTREVVLPERQIGTACLDPAELGRLASLATRLDQTERRPLAVEFCFGHDGVLYVLQCRPLIDAGSGRDPRSGIGWDR